MISEVVLSTIIIRIICQSEFLVFVVKTIERIIGKARIIIVIFVAKVSPNDIPTKKTDRMEEESRKRRRKNIVNVVNKVSIMSTAKKCDACMGSTEIA